MFSAGNGFGNVKNKEYIFETLTMLQYRLPASLVRAIADSAFNKTRDEYLAIGDLDTLELKLAELTDDKTAGSIMMQNRTTGELLPLYEYSPKFNKTFVLTDLIMHWKAEENSFWCEDTFGVSNIGRKNINAQMHGKLEIHKNPIFHVYE